MQDYVVFLSLLQSHEAETMKLFSTVECRQKCECYYVLTYCCQVMITLWHSYCMLYAWHHIIMVNMIFVCSAIYAFYITHGKTYSCIHENCTYFVQITSAYHYLNLDTSTKILRMHILTRFFKKWSLKNCIDTVLCCIKISWRILSF